MEYLQKVAAFVAKVPEKAYLAVIVLLLVMVVLGG
jgi:hypothetical protein